MLHLSLVVALYELLGRSHPLQGQARPDLPVVRGLSRTGPHLALLHSLLRLVLPLHVCSFVLSLSLAREISVMVTSDNEAQSPGSDE